MDKKIKKSILFLFFSCLVLILFTNCNSDFDKLFDDKNNLYEIILVNSSNNNDISIILESSNTVGLWSFENDVSGGIVQDSSTYGNDGTMENFSSNTSVAGREGQALEFDGSDDFVNLGTNLSILQNVSGVTLAAWVKPDSIFVETKIIAFSIYNSGSMTEEQRASLSLSLYSIKAAGRAPDSQGLQEVSATTILSSDTWYHVAAVIDYANDSITIYLDGQQEDSEAVNFINITTDNSVSASSAIGSEADGGDSFFNGMIDEVIILNRPLSASEIESLYNLY